MARPSARGKSSKPGTAAPAPSRIRNERQRQILETVEGYESITSYGAALWNVQVLWVLVGLVLIALGSGILALGETATSTSLFRYYTALSYGMGLLSFLTAFVAIIWSIKAIANVSRMARPSNFGPAGIVARHLPMLVVGGALFAAAGIVQDYERPLKIVGAVGIVWGLLVVAGLGHGALKHLWRTSAEGEVGSDGENRSLTLWFAGIVVFAYGTTATEFLNDITLAASGLLIVLTGIGALVAGATAVKVLPQLASRQDARVTAILESFGEEEASPQPVTAEQIEEAWAASSDLFTVD